MVQENEDFGSHFEDGLAVPRRAISLAWPIVLIAAIAIHHVTGSPIAAASLLAIHAGWKSFRCGLWLKSADPVASRGWACFWFYLATAFWRAAAWACGVILGFLVLAIWTGRPPSDREVMVELCTLVGGVFLSTAAGIVAITFALSGKVSVWVQPDVREQCCGDFVRLGDTGGYYVGGRNRGFNHAIFIVATSLFVPVFGCAASLLAWSTAIGQPPDAGALLELMGFFLIFPGSFVTIPVYAIIAGRIVARTPMECWLPGTLTREQLITTAENILLELDRREERDA